MKRNILFISLLLVVFIIFSCGKEPMAPESQGTVELSKGGPTGEPEVIAAVQDINEQLAAMGMNVRIELVEFFTVGASRPATRILQQPFRWRPSDPNRLAQGDDITYIVDHKVRRVEFLLLIPKIGPMQPYRPGIQIRLCKKLI